MSVRIAILFFLLTATSLAAVAAVTDPINRALEHHDYPLALDLCDKMLATKLTTSDKFAVLFARTDANLGLHKYKDAIADAELALKTGTADRLNKSWVCMREGMAYESLKDYPKSLELYSRSQSYLQPSQAGDIVGLTKWRVRVLNLMHRYDEAIKEINSALKLVEWCQKGKQRLYTSMVGKAEQVQLMYLRSKTYQLGGHLAEAKRDKEAADKLSLDF